MGNIVLLLCLFGTLLTARENPFFPAEGVQEMPVTSNVSDNRAPLKRASVSLPDSARVLKGVTLQYQNLDGTIETKSVELDQSVDWHIPVFITQSFPDAVKPEAAAQQTAPAKTMVADFGFIRVVSEGTLLHINTKDALIRHFMMTLPHRIVIDFKADRSFRSKAAALNVKHYERIRIGNHDGYYRVVIELDGQYRTEVRSTATGITIESF